MHVVENLEILKCKTQKEIFNSITLASESRENLKLTGRFSNAAFKNYKVFFSSLARFFFCSKNRKCNAQSEKKRNEGKKNVRRFSLSAFLMARSRIILCQFIMFASFAAGCYLLIFRVHISLNAVFSKLRIYFSSGLNA